MALKKYSTPSTFYAFAASCNACRMRRKRLIRLTLKTRLASPRNNQMNAKSGK
ncbi:hypothetical protein ECP03023082_5187 [Escherichia coli P0302308.2]|nr:hypothetical protein EC180200_5128 [Escherichia coli 180200]END06256.1 hypothetical protein ECP03023082_5187 [Escherichia coli P0302308.2]